MSQINRVFFGERSLTKVAGIFSSRQVAEGAARDLLGASALTESQVRVLSPLDGQAPRQDVLGRAVEPDSPGIARTLVRAHVSMGLLGMLAGAVLYGVLYALGNVALRSTPGMAFVALTGFGTTFGLIVGGALSLRPDHGRVISVVRRGLQSGRWAVVAHPLGADQVHQAVASLKGGSVRVVRSF